jgi:hypothetical protein
MTLTSKNDTMSIFRDGKLKPGIYKIQNLVGQTYVDITHVDTRGQVGELCCRPATLLEGHGRVSSLPHLTRNGNHSLSSVGNTPFGPRIYHTQGRVPDSISLLHELNEVVQLEPDQPEQFCIRNGGIVCVSPFPVAWRLEIVRDGRYPGCEYIR